MSFRSGNFGVVAGLAVMVLGVILVGADPSETELQVIWGSAFAVGITVMMVVLGREERREQGRSPDK